MRNLHFTATKEFSVTHQWDSATHKVVRKALTNSLYVLFETPSESRALKHATPSEARVLIAFRRWYLRMCKNEVDTSFVYMNVNTGASIVVKIDNTKALLVDPRFLRWESLPYSFNL